MSAPGLPVAAVLLERFRRAGTQLQWRDAPRVPGGRAKRRGRSNVRIAHLNDEEARVLDLGDGRLVTDSGPVGALVMLLEIDRRGPPTVLRARSAGEEAGFDQGALEARWNGEPVEGPMLPLTDLVQLARYALA